MFEAQRHSDFIALHPDEEKLARQNSGEQGLQGEQGVGGYGTDVQLGYDPETGAPKEPGSNWLAFEGLSQEELGDAYDLAPYLVGLEDREDNGQSGPTRDNGGLGYGDEEGLGRTGLTEAGAFGQSDKASDFDIEVPVVDGSSENSGGTINLDDFFGTTIPVRLD